MLYGKSCGFNPVEWIRRWKWLSSWFSNEKEKSHNILAQSGAKQRYKYSSIRRWYDFYTVKNQLSSPP